MDRATESFDSVVTIPRRKLCAAALCKVLEATGKGAGDGALRRNRLAGVFSCCSDVIL